MKKTLKLIVDILMTVVFVLLMCVSQTGSYLHEIMGIMVIILFVIHQILNINFYKNIFKGKYGKIRIAFMVVDITLLIMMIVMMVSALMISQNILTFIQIGNDSLGRTLHIFSTYTIYMLCGVHLGLHYNMIIKLKNEKKMIVTGILLIFSILFGSYGFIKREFISKLTLQSVYPLYFEESLFVTLVDYIGILTMFTMIGYGIYQLCILKRKKEK